MKPCPFLSHEHPIRFAHRGGSLLWPENTLTAFQGALDLGYRYIETDVHATRDGVIFIFHDDTLERVTEGTGNVHDHDWEDLKKLDAAYYFKPEAGYPLRHRGIRIPTLEEAMAEFPDLLFNIEVKQPGIESLLAEFIFRRGYEDRVLVASFHDGTLRRFRKIAGDRVATSTGLWETTAFWATSRIHKIFRTPARAIQVPVRMKGIIVVDRHTVETAHTAGKQVHIWTINEPDEMRRLLDLGVDGIMTDRPDLLNEVMNCE